MISRCKLVVRSPGHWRRLVKNILWANQNIGCANQNIGEKKVLKSYKCMGVSQLLGHVPGLPPKVYTYAPGPGNLILTGIK